MSTASRDQDAPAISARDAAIGALGRARLAALLFVFVWISGAWFGSIENNPNNATRLLAAIALVENHTANFDQYSQLTIDKADFGGHTYLDKAPGMTLMAVPVVAVVDRVTGKTVAQQQQAFQDAGVNEAMRPRLRVAAAVSSALFTAIAAAMLFLLAAELTGNAGAGLFAAIGYALGTPIWGWSTTIFGHAADAALFVIATALIWRGTRDDRPGTASAFFAGLALGWAFVVEYQAAATGVAIGCFALWRLWRYPAGARVSPIIAAMIGAAIALIPLVAYNQFAFGTPFKLGYEGVVGFQGMKQGVFGITYPKPLVLLKILFSVRRGLVWVAPVLVLAPIGLTLMVRDRRMRDLGILAIVGALIVILINASYIYWDGGSSTGPRLSVPAIGFLAIGLAPCWTWLRAPWAKTTALWLLGISVGLNLIIAAADITAPGGFPNPVWTWVIQDRFLNGYMRDFPAEFWHWQPWQGFALYVMVAVGFVLVILRTQRVAQVGDQPAG